MKTFFFFFGDDQENYAKTVGRWSEDLFLKLHKILVNFGRVACGSIGVKGHMLFKKPEI